MESLGRTLNVKEGLGRRTQCLPCYLF
jgi:hypothetical protein